MDGTKTHLIHHKKQHSSHIFPHTMSTYTESIDTCTTYSDSDRSRHFGHFVQRGVIETVGKHVVDFLGQYTTLFPPAPTLAMTHAASTISHSNNHPGVDHLHALGFASKLALTMGTMGSMGSKEALNIQLLHSSNPMLSQMDFEGTLGSGAFGEVQLTRSRLDTRLTAIKTIRFVSKCGHAPWCVPLQHGPGGMCMEHEVLLREVRTLMKCQDCAHVVRYHACWIEPDWESLAAAAMHVRSEQTLTPMCLITDTNAASPHTTSPQDPVPWPFVMYILMEPGSHTGMTLADWIGKRNQDIISHSRTLTIAFGETECSIAHRYLLV
jgi:hypothetical protein